ncbi:MAG TPA: hypothetical protein VIX19_01700 [Terriglobales bacterium]
MGKFVLWAKRATHVCLLGFLSTFPVVMRGQDEGATPPDAMPPAVDERFKAVPILTGYTSYFTRVTAGQYQDSPSFAPLLLLPVGDKWLVESRGSYSLTYTEQNNGSYLNTNSYGLVYAQVDYIANRYVTVVAGRFITPFGMYSERLSPSWIRALQLSPLNTSIESGSSLGGMLRGGFPAGTEKVNFNYAVYYSANNTNHILATTRSSGGRVGLFLPGPRLEIGASFQQVLQGVQYHVAGVHSEWQTYRLPLTLRSEFIRSSGTKGSGYWIESVYRLNQLSWLRRAELAGRGQQTFADPKLTLAQARSLGTLGIDTNEGDAGVNYYLGRDVRASACFGRQFAFNKDANLWVMGITYRFLMPMGPTGGMQ